MHKDKRINFEFSKCFDMVRSSDKLFLLVLKAAEIASSMLAHIQILCSNKLLRTFLLTTVELLKMDRRKKRILADSRKKEKFLYLRR